MKNAIMSNDELMAMAKDLDDKDKLASVLLSMIVAIRMMDMEAAFVDYVIDFVLMMMLSAVVADKMTQDAMSELMTRLSRPSSSVN